MRKLIDEIDLRIFEIIKRDKEVTTTKLAKEIFNPKDDYELRKKDSLIRKRLKKWNDLGVVKLVKRVSTSYYSIPFNRIFLGEGEIRIVEKNREVRFKIGEALALKTNFGWILFKPLSLK
jgi:hypothetical protein